MSRECFIFILLLPLITFSTLDLQDSCSESKEVVKYDEVCEFISPRDVECKRVIVEEESHDKR